MISLTSFRVFVLRALFGVMSTACGHQANKTAPALQSSVTAGVFELVAGNERLGSETYEVKSVGDRVTVTYQNAGKVGDREFATKGTLVFDLQMRPVSGEFSSTINGELTENSVAALSTDQPSIPPMPLSFRSKSSRSNVLAEIKAKAPVQLSLADDSFIAHVAICVQRPQGAIKVFPAMPGESAVVHRAGEDAVFLLSLPQGKRIAVACEGKILVGLLEVDNDILAIETKHRAKATSLFTSARPVIPPRS
jgi:hypothetical protein